MTDYLEIGPAPYDEDCAQTTDPDFFTKNREECRRFIELIRKKCGEEPESASLTIRSNPHDFGTYREVAVRYELDNPVAMAYALHVERHAPATWDDTIPKLFTPPLSTLSASG